MAKKLKRIIKKKLEPEKYLQIEIGIDETPIKVERYGRHIMVTLDK